MTSLPPGRARREHPWPVYEPQEALAEALWLFSAAHPADRERTVETMVAAGPLHLDPADPRRDGSAVSTAVAWHRERRGYPVGWVLNAAVTHLWANGVDVQVLHRLLPATKNSGVFVDLLLLGLQAGMSETEIRTALETRAWPDQDALALMAGLRTGVRLVRAD